jgi:hypothetical protein
MQPDSIRDIQARLFEQVKTLKDTFSELEASKRSEMEDHGRPLPPPLVLDGALISSILSGRPEWFQVFTTQLASITTLSQSDLSKLLIVSTLLNLQKKFKLFLLSSDTFRSVYARALSLIDPQDDLDSSLWYKECFFALFKCKDDRPRLVTPQMESAGMTFADQLKFEASLEANPEMASALGTQAPTTTEWAMDRKESDDLLKFFVTESIITRLVHVKATGAICCIIRLVEFRSMIVKHHAVSVLMNTELTEPIRVAIARLCMTLPPHIWSYSQSVFCAKAVFELLQQSQYELYQFEACIGLVNLLSYSEEVRELISRMHPLNLLFDLLASTENERLQTAITEVICNLCLCDELVAQFTSERIKILIFLSTSSTNPPLQCATAGALAILSGYELMLQFISPSYPELVTLTRSTNPDVVLRGVTILANLAVGVSDLAEPIQQTLKAVDSADERIRSVLEACGC